MYIRYFRTDVFAWNCVMRAVEDTQAHIIRSVNLSMDSKMAATSDVRKMKQELQGAIAEGGRLPFELSAKKWERHHMWSYFEKQLNKHLAAAPRPSRREGSGAGSSSRAGY